MCLIYAFLAIRMIRLARSDLRYRNGDEAFERSRDRVRQAEVLADRADLPSLAAMR
ncbi:hypothetical protein [Methylobacterium sp. NEAU K]|uniref:hypothetical protein n=1 Tax=Methylobacterium sp. NEAU K TaxID=3064946 RepID=UPI002735E445|nr:hypothetical protein [Methylobacterium sp. NEAU K]MDP4006925.1 hypothetical protein [Methylobacterium sp. NEAU K]